jgi:hypothetical protein
LIKKIHKNLIKIAIYHVILGTGIPLTIVSKTQFSLPLNSRLLSNGLVIAGTALNFLYLGLY